MAKGSASHAATLSDQRKGRENVGTFGYTSGDDACICQLPAGEVRDHRPCLVNGGEGMRCTELKCLLTFECDRIDSNHVTATGNRRALQCVKIGGASGRE